MLGKMFATFNGLSWKAFPIMGSFCSQKEVVQKQPLCEQGQRIVWNWAIIKHIRDTSPIKDPKEGSQLSLREQLISLKLPQSAQKYEFNPAINKQAIKLFKEGIVLNPIIYNQQRIADATQKNQDPTKPSSSFIFCPNYLVTQKIFNYLLPSIDDVKFSKNLLLTGGPGIGKTVSIILFIQLVNEIHRNYYQASKSKQKMKELQQLQEEKLICKRTIPRYFYWSIQKQDLKKQNHMMNLVLQQTSELTEEQKKQLLKEKSFKQFKLKLEKFYPQLTFKVVVDQINHLVSLMRQANHKKIDKNIPKGLYDLYTQFISLGETYILNSSQTIQQDLLFQTPFDILTLGIDKHQRIPIVRIPFEESLSTKQGTIDFWKTFWFQLQRKLLIFAGNMQKAIKTTMIQSIKAQFQKTVQNTQVGALGAFLHIRNHIQTYHQNFKQILNQIGNEQQLKQNQHQLNNLVVLIISQFDTYCIGQRSIVIRQFYEKGDYMRKKIIEIIHSHTSKNIQMKKTDKLVEVSLNTLENHPNLKALSFNKSIKNIVNDIDFRQIFPFTIKNSKTIYLPWTNLQFYALVMRVFYPETARFTTQDALESIGNKTMLGLQIQDCLIQCLGPNSFLNFYMDKKIVQAYMITGKKLFPSLEKTNNELFSSNMSRLQRSFNGLFELCKNSGPSSFLAIPSSIHNGVQGHNRSHPTIDFVIVSLDRQRNQQKFKISSFDVTVAGRKGVKDYNDVKNNKLINQPKGKTGKAYKFLGDLFEQFKRKKQMKEEVELTHYIICPKQSIPQATQDMDSNFKIKYLNLYQMWVFQPESRDAHLKLMMKIEQAKAADKNQ